MLIDQNMFLTLLTFLILCFSASQFGKLFATIKLPIITGYLFLGILVGPNLLDLIDQDQVVKLNFIDELALAFIAFTAGSELFWRDIKSKLKVMSWLTFSILTFTFVLCSTAIFFLSQYIDFLEKLPATSQLAISILGGAILVARSPSSAIAVVNELKAKGSFTQIALGVTVIMDILVIVLFTVCNAIADPLLSDKELNLLFIGKLILELALSFVCGLGLRYLLSFLIGINVPLLLKSLFVIVVGYFTFYTCENIIADMGLHLEPLLMCIVAGFFIANFDQNRRIFIKVIHNVSTYIYVAFFALTGASLTLSVLKDVWYITLILLSLRIVGIYLGSYIGGRMGNDNPKYRHVRWMCFITQAGVGLGLSKKVADSYPDWGGQFATIIISVIIINEIFGPIAFKWVLRIVGDVKSRAKKSEAHAIPSAVIFGENNHSIALSRQLCAHNWQVKLVSNSKQILLENELFSNTVIESLTKKSLEKVKADDSDTFVVMQDDKSNLKTTSLIRDVYDESHVIVALNDRNSAKYFKDLNASLVDPSTSFISLLDHYVRSPSAVSLLLGYEKNHDIIDCLVKNEDLKGVTLIDLNLPDNILILSIVRNGQALNVHAGVRLELDDCMTLAGPEDVLETCSFKITQTASAT